VQRQLDSSPISGTYLVTPKSLRFDRAGGVEADGIFLRQRVGAGADEMGGQG